MNLDKPRIERLISTISENKYVVRILRNFLASAEESKTYLELGKTKEYICYVLKPLVHYDRDAVDQDRGGKAKASNQQNSGVVIRTKDGSDYKAHSSQKHHHSFDRQESDQD